MTVPRRIVAYADLLGFSDMVIDQPDLAREILSNFYNFAQNTKTGDGFDDLELFLFSDFLFIQGDHVAQVVNYMCRLYRRALEFSENNPGPMLIRGGVARGGVLTQRRSEAAQVTKNFIVSPALTHAVKMESLVKGQRLLISAKEREQVDHFWNDDIHAICYDQPSLKPSALFKKYRYQDLLWARDLSLEHADARAQTRRYLSIAAKLFRDKSKMPKGIAAQYAETLRVCLLAYSGLLQPLAEDRDLISDLVEETLLPHPHPSVWLGFLECVLLSADAFAFHMESSMAKFLRAAVMSEHWSEISKALNEPEHHQLKGAVQDFIEAAIPNVRDVS